MMKANIRAVALLAIAAALYGWAVHAALRPSNLLQMMEAMTLC